jgi:hypothetical protein
MGLARRLSVLLPCSKHAEVARFYFTTITDVGGASSRNCLSLPPLAHKDERVTAFRPKAKYRKVIIKRGSALDAKTTHNGEAGAID